MRRALALLALIALVVAVPALAAGTGKKFKGKTDEGGRVSFKLTAGGKYVRRFRFANRCPSDSARGNLVPGRMKVREVRNGRRVFSYKDDQFTIRGHFVSNRKAKGTAQNDTGDCHSGKLHWKARYRP